MAVAYLENAWDPQMVRTKNRGKNFIFASHNFETNNGKVGVGFHNFDQGDGEMLVAFSFTDEDTGGLLDAKGLIDLFLEEYHAYDNDESALDFTDFEEFQEVINPIGDLGGFAHSSGFDDLDEIQSFYNDISKKYF